LFLKFEMDHIKVADNIFLIINLYI
jgi:hypothetical protein